MTEQSLQTIRKEQGSFIKSDEQLKEIAQSFPHQRMLIRCGGGRFIAPAQDTQHFVSIITKEGSDYVRDVSLFSD